MDFTVKDMSDLVRQGDHVDFIRQLMGRPVAHKRHRAESVRCPHCEASPGERCTRPTGGRLSAPIHEVRLDAYAQSKNASSNS